MTQNAQTDFTAGSGANDLARQATQRSLGLMGEFLLFLKWWLLPIVVVLGAGVLIIMVGTFIYSLF
ncbi:MAG TPA: hypothetical protein VMB70_13320 [Terriglobia bacterium]|nr:hypothetical protein [Terriglobia bacterium]